MQRGFDGGELHAAMLPHWIGRKQVQSISPAVQAVPVGPSHTPLLTQHGTVVEHIWPAYAHVEVPMSPGGGAAQLPIVEPGGMVHKPPAQQSAVVVHAPL